MKANPFLVALVALLLAACGEENGTDPSLFDERDTVSDRSCRGGECGERPNPRDEARPPHDRPAPEKPGKGAPSPRPWHPVGDEGWTCVKIEDESIGADETTVSVGVATLWIDSWVEKEDSPNEWIGFAWTLSDGPVSIRVKAGPEVFEALLEDESGVWIHPEGTSGPKAKAISNIVFCGLEEHGDEDPKDPQNPEDPEDEEGEDDEEEDEIIVE